MTAPAFSSDPARAGKPQSVVPGVVRLWVLLCASVSVLHLSIGFLTQSSIAGVLAMSVWGGAFLCMEDRTPNLRPAATPLGLWLGSILLTAVLWRTSQISDLDIAFYALPPFAGIGLAMMLVPSSRLREFWEPLCALSLLPLGLVLFRFLPERHISEFTAYITQVLLRGVGVRSDVQGRLVLIDGGGVVIQGPCSGVELVAQMVVIAIVFLLAFRIRAWWRRGLVLLFAPVLAVLGNSFRIACLALINASSSEHKETLFRFFHDDSGSLLFAGLTLSVFGWLYMRILEPELKPAVVQRRDTPRAPATQAVARPGAGSDSVNSHALVGETKSLKFLLLVLGAMAIAAAAPMTLGLTMSVPDGVRWTSWKPTGYKVAVRSLAQESTRRDLAHGEIVRLDAVPDDLGLPPFVVTLVPVRMRAAADFSVAAINLHFPAIGFERDAEKSLGDTSDAVSPYVLGKVGDRPALQTCITADGTAATAKDALSSNIDAARDRSLSARLKQVAGLQPPARWECVLVTLSVVPGEAASGQLRAAWAQAYDSWQSQMAWRAVQR